MLHILRSNMQFPVIYGQSRIYPSISLLTNLKKSHLTYDLARLLSLWHTNQVNSIQMRVEGA